MQPQQTPQSLEENWYRAIKLGIELAHERDQALAECAAARAENDRLREALRRCAAVSAVALSGAES